MYLDTKYIEKAAVCICDSGNNTVVTSSCNNVEAGMISVLFCVGFELLGK